MSPFHFVDKHWTLFLDRDGVINLEKEGDYIRSAEELILYPGTEHAIATLKQYFGRLIVVTNQRGIGRGLMHEQDLHEIHKALQAKLSSRNTSLDAFYFAPDLDNNAPRRKPNTGMALLAKADFPDIDFSRSMMIGNNLSDMKFGQQLGMKTVFVETTSRLSENAGIDWVYPNLVEFARMFEPNS